MTDTNELNTNTITHQTPKELSEQDMQAVNGGMPKVGNPQAMLEEVLNNPRLSTSSSLGISRMETGHEVPPPPEQSGGLLSKVTSNHSKVFAAQVFGGAAGSAIVGAATGK